MIGIRYEKGPEEDIRDEKQGCNNGDIMQE
jgi:hypothetical protein